MLAHAGHARRALAAATATVLLCGSAWAQTTAAWPTRPVRIVVGFPGGSTPDVAARVLADAMGKAWGQTVLVDNRPGAAGNIAADQVAKASDDHTLGVVINGNLTSAKLLNPRLPYDPARDFTLVSLVATAPLVLVAPANLPHVSSGSTFFAAAREAGNTWSYGSVGLGSVGHLGMEVVKSRAPGFDAVHVPYNGNPAVITALLSGQIQAALVPPGLALPQVQAGKLRAVGLTGPRSPLAPEVPALSELGVNVSGLEVWVALAAPASLGKAAQDRLAHDVPLLLNEADTRQRLISAGWQAQGSSAEVLRARVRDETALLGGIITSRGIKAE